MKLRYILAIVLSFIVLLSCDNEEPISVQPSRTVLVYMAGDNSLSSFIDKNLRMMLAGAKDNLNNGNLLVYADRAGDVPYLYQIKQVGDKVEQIIVRTYEEHNSASPETLTEVLNSVMRDYPADGYGLVLWSHGTAWLPANLGGYLRAFGEDGDHIMELNELSGSLSGYHFDFILFDACYMSSTESAYAFRNCTDYLIGSPTEVLATGFPYEKIIQPMFTKEAQVEKIASEFYDYYNNQPVSNRYGTVSLLKTAGMENLATACRSIFQGKSNEELFSISVKDLQLMEYLTYNFHALYDFDDYISRLATPEQYTAFRKALNEVVTYKATTPQSYFALPKRGINMDKFCGLSVYVPQQALPKLNDWYKDLEWYKAVYK